MKNSTKEILGLVFPALFFFLLGFILGIGMQSCSSMNHIDFEPIIETVSPLAAQPDDTQTDTVTIGEERQALAYYEAYQALIERRNTEIKQSIERQSFLELTTIIETVLLGGLSLYILVR